MRTWIVVSNVDGAVLGSSDTYAGAAAIGSAAWEADLAPSGWTALPYDGAACAFGESDLPAFLIGKLAAADAYAAGE